jgi:hypothetical protein
MEELDNLTADMKGGLTSLQSAQALYDEDMWDITDPAFAKLRHIHLHLSNTVGKLAKLVEPLDHQVHAGAPIECTELADELAPIVADLMMHSAQIANLSSGDMGAWLIGRYKQNASRFAPESAFARME